MANVLIVDDSSDTVALSAELLEAAGHCITTGFNGEEGLKSLNAGPLPDCVLLDVDMPVLNGPEMAHRMPLHDAGEERIPILLVSGRNDLQRSRGAWERRISSGKRAQTMERRSSTSLIERFVSGERHRQREACESSRQKELRDAPPRDERLLEREIVARIGDDRERGPRDSVRESARGLCAEEGIVLAGEYQRLRLNVTKLAARVVKDTGERVLEKGDARRGADAQTPLDCADLLGVNFAKARRKDPVDEARLHFVDGSRKAGGQRELAAETGSAELEPSRRSGGEAELRHASRGKDREPGGRHAPERDAKNMSPGNAEVGEDLKGVAREALRADPRAVRARVTRAAEVERDDAEPLRKELPERAPERHRAAKRAYEQDGDPTAPWPADLIRNLTAVRELGEPVLAIGGAGRHDAFRARSARSSSALCISTRTLSRMLSGFAPAGAGIGANARS